jgi:hypothetical protein
MATNNRDRRIRDLDKEAQALGQLDMKPGGTVPQTPEGADSDLDELLREARALLGLGR